MIRYSYCLLLVFLMLSCTKTNDYYVGKKDSSENVNLKNIKGIRVLVSAMKVKNRLIISTYVRLTDEKILLEDITVEVKGIEKPLLEEKSCNMMTGSNIKTITFNTFKDIKDEINDSQMTFILYNIIKDPKVNDLDDLDFKVHIKSNYGTYNKRVILEKHSRFRLFPEGA